MFKKKKPLHCSLYCQDKMEILHLKSSCDKQKKKTFSLNGDITIKTQFLKIILL